MRNSLPTQERVIAGSWTKPVWKVPAWFCKSSRKDVNVGLYWISWYCRWAVLQLPMGRTSITRSGCKAEPPKVVPNSIAPCQSLEIRKEAELCLMFQRSWSGPISEWIYKTLKYSQWAALIQLVYSTWVLEFLKSKDNLPSGEQRQFKKKGI